MNYREMQKLLKDNGLNAKGSKQELEARLEEDRAKPAEFERVGEVKPVEEKPVKKKENMFVYIGHGMTKPPTILKWGYKFVLNGNPVNVDNPDVAMRLRLHVHFKEV